VFSKTKHNYISHILTTDLKENLVNNLKFLLIPFLYSGSQIDHWVCVEMNDCICDLRTEHVFILLDTSSYLRLCLTFWTEIEPTFLIVLRATTHWTSCWYRFHCETHLKDELHKFLPTSYHLQHYDRYLTASRFNRPHILLRTTAATDY